MNNKELIRQAWQCETSDEFDYGTDLYFAARAVEKHGSALRDNTFEQLVAIGKAMEKEDEPDPNDKSQEEIQEELNTIYKDIK